MDKTYTVEDLKKVQDEVDTLRRIFKPLIITATQVVYSDGLALSQNLAALKLVIQDLEMNVDNI